MAEEVENAIRQNAQGPESAEADGVKVKQHPLADQTRRSEKKDHFFQPRLRGYDLFHGLG